MRGRMITAAVLVVVGLIWIGQGSGLLRGSSFMIGDTRWAVAGVVAVIVGAVLAFIGWRNSRPGG